MTGVILTPNLKLSEMPANFKVWAQLMNDNLIAIDAAISGFIVFNNLRGAWTNSTAYAVSDTVVDPATAVIWQAQVAHTSSVIPTTFAQARALFPTFWTVYSAPAKARGAWTGPGTSYALNDFVVSGSQYAVCIAGHVSSGTFAIDLALSRWSVLVDLSAAGSLVLPILGGASDANKLVVTSPAGTAYQVAGMAAALIAGGATALGISLLEATSQAAARSVIGAGTASTFDVGTGPQNIVQLDGSSRLPGVNGSQLTNLPIPGSSSSIVFLGANVGMPTTGFVDIMNTGAIGAAGQIWLIIAQAIIINTATATQVELGLWDGSQYIANPSNTIPNTNWLTNITAMAVVTLSGPTTFTMRTKDAATGSSIVSTSGYSTGVANKGTCMLAVRLS